MFFEIMTDVKETAIREIEAYKSLLHQISNTLWNNPELSNEEFVAHDTLATFLETEGFHVERSYKLKTAFRGTYETAPQPHIVVICEYDALPDIGHACGHNLIAEVGLAAGIGIKAAMVNYKLKGKITVLGTPAEEECGGKLELIRQGAFDGVCAALMAHPSSRTEVKAPLLSVVTLEVTFMGKASHASGSPWEGVNALDAAVSAYQSISNLRQQMKPKLQVHGIIKEGGTRPNIIPEKTVLEYYIRAPNDKEVSVLREKVSNCFKAAALATGCTCEIKQTIPPYSSVVYNDVLCRCYKMNMDTLGVAMQPDSTTPLGSTDMGNVSYVVPSIHPMFYIGGIAPNHSHEFTKLTGADAAQPYTLNQGKALAMTAIDVLLSSELRAEMAQTFENDMQQFKA